MIDNCLKFCKRKGRLSFKFSQLFLFFLEIVGLNQRHIQKPS